MAPAKKTEELKVYKDYAEFKRDFNYNDPNYAFYYKFIKRPISYPMTWFVYKKTNLTPNVLTYIGFVFALLSALFFSLGTYACIVAGVILFFLYEVFDDFDGIIARSKGIRSRRGGWLDILAGCIGKVLVMLGVSLGVFRITGDPYMLILGLVAIVGATSINSIDHVTKIRYSVVVQKKLKFVDTKPDPKTLAGKLSVLSEIMLNIWFVVLILAGLTNRLSVFLWFSAIYYTLYSVAQFFYLNRKYKNV